MYMKRKDLEALGLEDEAIEKIMSLHGQTVNGLNSQITDLKDQITQRDEDLEQLQADNEGNQELSNKLTALQAEYDELKAKSNENIENIKRDSLVEIAIRDAQARNPKLLKGALDLDKIEVTDGKLVGLDEQIESLKQSDGYLFNLGMQTTGYTPLKGQNQPPMTKDEIMKIADKKERQQAIANNLELFN